MHVYMYMHVSTINQKRDHEFERYKKVIHGRFGGIKGKRKEKKITGWYPQLLVRSYC